MFFRLIGLVILLAVDIAGATVTSSPCRQQWGEYDINTNYYSVTPDTGRTVKVYS